LPECLLKRFVIFVVVEDLHPSVRAVEHMISIAAFGGSMWSSHTGSQ
jgi:hypothetical protein